jgi:hypothetical protein
VAPAPTQFTNTALPWSFTSNSPAMGLVSSSRLPHQTHTTTPPSYYPDHTQVNIVSKSSPAFPCACPTHDSCPAAKSPTIDFNSGLGRPATAVRAQFDCRGYCSANAVRRLATARRSAVDAVHQTCSAIGNGISEIFQQTFSSMLHEGGNCVARPGWIEFGGSSTSCASTRRDQFWRNAREPVAPGRCHVGYSRMLSFISTSCVSLLRACSASATTADAL